MILHSKLYCDLCNTNRYSILNLKIIRFLLGAQECITIPYKLKDFVALVTAVYHTSPNKPKVAPVLID